MANVNTPRARDLLKPVEYAQAENAAPLTIDATGEFTDSLSGLGVAAGDLVVVQIRYSGTKGGTAGSIAYDLNLGGDADVAGLHGDGLTRWEYDLLAADAATRTYLVVLRVTTGGTLNILPFMQSIGSDFSIGTGNIQIGAVVLRPS